MPTGELKSPWGDKGDYVVPQPDLGGAGVTDRGSDPNIQLGGTPALQPVWTNPVMPTPGGEESPNSVSGLPSLPSRFEPSGTPPAPPSLQDRSPGTIDQR